MNKELKKALDDLFALCEAVDASGLNIGNDSKARLKIEVQDFLAYLTAADGDVMEIESDFLKDYLEVNLTPQQLNDYIVKNNVYSVAFEKKVPEVLKRLIEYDNTVYSKSGTLKLSYSAAYIRVFNALGKEFLVVDGKATDQEVADFTTITNAYMDYRKGHYEGPAKVVSAIDTEKIHPGKQSKDEQDEKSLEELLQELDNLTGLHQVKDDVYSLIHLQEVQLLRKERGIDPIPMSNHLVFYGNPGTGKTTVARLLAQIYHKMGLLSKGVFVETDRSGLVGGYVGQTALKTQDVIKQAMGGVLFIDEAYALTHNTSENDYGTEAVDTILKAMEDNRDDLIVIVAGYPLLMQKFIDSNPGLRSRFNKHIDFPDYNGDELLEIFVGMCRKNKLTVADDAYEYVKTYMCKQYENRNENFSNGRMVRNFIERAILNQANRLHSIKNPTDEELCQLVINDVNELSKK